MHLETETFTLRLISR